MAKKKKMKQQILEIPLSELHLWSENPRDPMDIHEDEFEIIKRIFKDENKKWELKKFMKSMGEYYDLSELPTVVIKNGKKIVYDGNRRIAIIKYLQNPEWSHKIEGKLFPSKNPENFKNLKKIYCNVCDENTALINIERKHSNNSSWGQLERDYFEHHFRGKEKSIFLKFEESTHLISKNPDLNENIMKNNILTKSKLNKIGFSFDKYGKLVSVYEDDFAKKILNSLAELKVKKIISSRGPERYQIKKPLEKLPEFKGKIKEFKEKDSKKVDYDEDFSETIQIKKTKRQNAKKSIFFGEPLSLKHCLTNDIYKDLCHLNEYYDKNKDILSNTFPNFLRIGLRILVESAAKDSGQNMGDYIKSNFSAGKKDLDKDQKTFLSSQNVAERSLISLLQMGGHIYPSSSNLEQTKAISLIIAKMLKVTHKK